MAPSSGHVGSIPARQKLHSFFCFLWPVLPTPPWHGKGGLIFLLPESWEKKPLIFALPCVSLHLVLIRSQFTVAIPRSQCDSTDRDLHRRYPKYQKEMLIKILLSSAEVTRLCFWKPSACYRCSIPFTVVKAGIKVIQNEKKRHNSVKSMRGKKPEEGYPPPSSGWGKKSDAAAAAPASPCPGGGSQLPRCFFLRVLSNSLHAAPPSTFPSTHARPGLHLHQLH